MGTGNPAKRVTAAVGGGVLLLVGVTLLVLPGPGLLLVLAGLVVLASEFPAVERYVEPVRKRAMTAAANSVASPLRIAASILAGLALIGAGIAWALVPGLPLGSWSSGASLMLSGAALLGLLLWSHRRSARTANRRRRENRTAQQPAGPVPADEHRLGYRSADHHIRPDRRLENGPVVASSRKDAHVLDSRTGVVAPWWRHAVIYQLYVRSFADTDGDGIGDLGGVLDRLDYLQGLGIDGIWLNPCYPSPQADHGYDIADFTAINPEYGDVATFDTLVTEVHARGLRVLMDLVPNHCSVEHSWFAAALDADPGSPERQRFLFRDGRGAGGELPPNNWHSIFGGPAWTQTTAPDGSPGQWYLHLFDSAQPDFNWRNPDVERYFDDVLAFWFDRGVDGFRIDVAHGLVKDMALRDWDGDEHNAYAWNQPEVHDVYRRWRALADSYGPDRELTFVGEIWVPEVEDLARYLRPDELPQAFFFDLLVQPWRASGFRESIDRAIAQIGATGATITWNLANHDVHRAVTRYGLTRRDSPAVGMYSLSGLTRPRGEVDIALGERRARAALLLLLALPGSVYLYQGEELGLPEVLDLPDERRQDPIWRRSGGAEYGRDGCRVPLPWTSGGHAFGFSPAGGSPAQPWLPQPDWFAKYAVAVQEGDATSTLALNRRAIRLRRELIASVGAGQLQWLPAPGHPDVLALRHNGVTCVVNFGDRPIPLREEWGTPVLSSTAMETGALPGNAAVWCTHGA